jgi:uncharacterized delta-60 repeat protein
VTANFINGLTGQTAHTNWQPWARKLVWLPDGKFLGLADNLYRFNADDSIDYSFGVISNPVEMALLLKAEFLPDGRLLVSGHYTPDQAAPGNTALFSYALNPNGTLDMHFGEGKGFASADFGPRGDGLIGTTVQQDGKILMVSESTAPTPGSWGDDSRLVLNRLTADGKIDTSFGQRGFIAVDIANCRPMDMIVQRDGKIVVSCSVLDATGHTELKLIRFNTDGSKDKSFGTDGIASAGSPDVYTNIYMGKLGFQPDGSVVVMTNKILDHMGGAASGFDVIRFTANGKLDVGFGQGGHAVHVLPPDSPGGQFGNNPFDLIIQENGRIIIGLDVARPTESQIGLMALHTDGSIDTSWGNNGSYIADLGPGRGTGDGIFVRPDGTLFVNGLIYSPGSYSGIENSFSLNPDGTPDKNFGAQDDAKQNEITYQSGHKAEALNAYLALADIGAPGTKATLTLTRHGGANPADHFFTSAQVNGVVIGELKITDGALRMTFNTNVTAEQINSFLHSIKYSYSGELSTQQNAVIDWTYSTSTQTATFATAVTLKPDELPFWIEDQLGHLAADQTAAQLKAMLASYVGDDKTIDVSYVNDGGGKNIPAADLALLQGLVTRLASTVDLRIGTGTTSGRDSLTFHSASELAAGDTAYNGFASTGANIFFKQEAGGIQAMMGAIQSRLAQVLGLQADAGSLDPFGQLETAALQYLYGPSKITRSGNDSYQLSLENANFLWDSQGTDSIDGTALSQDLTLHLEAGHWDYIGKKGSAITTAGQITVNYGSTFENAYGGSGNDQLFGTAGANILSGGAGNDTLAGASGGDTLDGGSGIDTAIYAGKRAEYSISRSGDKVSVNGAGGTDSLTSVERLHFADADVALDIDGSAGQVYRLYQAILNRAPDLEGLGWWMYYVDRGAKLESIAESFVQSQEFKDKYGDNVSNAALVTKLYDNVLHRAPDTDGFAFWLDLLDNHKTSLGSVLIGFSESPENYALLVGSIQNGIAFTPFHG